MLERRHLPRFEKAGMRKNPKGRRKRYGHFGVTALLHGSQPEHFTSIESTMASVAAYQCPPDTFCQCVVSGCPSLRVQCDPVPPVPLRVQEPQSRLSMYAGAVSR